MSICHIEFMYFLVSGGHIHNMGSTYTKSALRPPLMVTLKIPSGNIVKGKIKLLHQFIHNTSLAKLIYIYVHCIYVYWSVYRIRHCLQLSGSFHILWFGVRGSIVSSVCPYIKEHAHVHTMHRKSTWGN